MLFRQLTFAIITAILTEKVMGMEKLLRTLQKNLLFRQLPVSVLREEILPRGQVQQLSRGQPLIAPQQKVDRLAIVLSGRVHIQHLFPNGTYSLLSVLEPSEVLGADLVCTQSRIAPYHAAAAEPTVLFLLPADLFLRPGTLDEPERLQVLEELLHLVANENMKKTYRLAILSQKGLRERILTFLTMQAGKRRTNTFSIAFSREDLASFLCVNRSALSHELSRMQQEGLIVFHKNQFTLLRDSLPPHSEVTP